MANSSLSDPEEAAKLLDELGRFHWAMDRLEARDDYRAMMKRVRSYVEGLLDALGVARLEIEVITQNALDMEQSRDFNKARAAAAEQQHTELQNVVERAEVRANYNGERWTQAEAKVQELEQRLHEETDAHRLAHQQWLEVRKQRQELEREVARLTAQSKVYEDAVAEWRPLLMVDCTCRAIEKCDRCEAIDKKFPA